MELTRLEPDSGVEQIDGFVPLVAHGHCQECEKNAFNVLIYVENTIEDIDTEAKKRVKSALIHGPLGWLNDHICNRCGSRRN